MALNRVKKYTTTGTFGLDKCSYARLYFLYTNCVIVLLSIAIDVLHYEHMF